MVRRIGGDNLWQQEGNRLRQRYPMGASPARKRALLPVVLPQIVV